MQFQIPNMYQSGMETIHASDIDTWCTVYHGTNVWEGGMKKK